MNRAVIDTVRVIDYAMTGIIPIIEKETGPGAGGLRRLTGDAGAYSSFSLCTSQPSSTASDAGRNTSTFLKY